jgi:CRP-like cAMP-binding protein
MNNTIFKEGDHANKIYFILQGEFKVQLQIILFYRSLKTSGCRKLI